MIIYLERKLLERKAREGEYHCIMFTKKYSIGSFQSILANLKLLPWFLDCYKWLEAIPNNRKWRQHSKLTINNSYFSHTTCYTIPPRGAPITDSNFPQKFYLSILFVVLFCLVFIKLWACSLLKQSYGCFRGNFVTFFRTLLGVIYLVHTESFPKN